MPGIGSNTVFLLHGDGASAASVFIDSARGKNVSTANTGVRTTNTGTSHFGPTAIYFSGAGYLQTPYNADLHFGSGDFTIDFRFKPNAANSMMIWAIGDNPTDLFYIRHQMYSTMDIVLLSNAVAILACNAGGIYSNDRFTHCALTRASGITRFFVDGILSASISSAWSMPAILTGKVHQLGAYGTTRTQFVTGWLDEFRITKGVAIWTDTFTPPTEAYSWDIPVATMVISDAGTAVESITSAVISENPDPVTLTLSAPTVPHYELAVYNVTDVATLTLSPSVERAGSLQYEKVDRATLEFTAPSCNAGQPVLGNINLDLPAFEVDTFSGHNVFDDERTELPAFTGSMTGTFPLQWTIRATLPAITGSMTSSRGVNGTIEATIPHITGSLTATRTIGGTINKTLPKITSQLTGKVGIIGRFNDTLPAITADVDMSYGISCSINATLPAFTGSFRIDSLVFQAFAVTLLNKALTTFSNYPFNSFAYFNGVYLGCSKTGIYQLGGTDDAGTDISAYAETGFIDLEKGGALKRLRHAILGYTSSGNLTLSVITDNAVAYGYDVEMRDSNAYEGTRVKIGKGLKDRYIAVKLANANGASFKLDTMRLFCEPVTSKQR